MEQLNKDDLIDYVEGVITTPLTFQCPQKLFKEFKQFCTREAGGNKILALEKLLNGIRIDETTAMLLERDEQLKNELDSLFQQIEEIKKDISEREEGSENKLTEIISFRNNTRSEKK